MLEFLKYSNKTTCRHFRHSVLEMGAIRHKNCNIHSLRVLIRYDMRCNSKSLGIHVVSPEEEEKAAAVGRICRKGRF